MRGERRSEHSAQPAAAAGGDFVAFWLTINKQHTNTSDDISYSCINVKLNGMAFGMDCPLLVENERLKIRLRNKYFCQCLFVACEDARRIAVD